jgi:phospholipid/cholesterol/gamma-HCH transport system permease protein
MADYDLHLDGSSGVLAVRGDWTVDRAQAAKDALRALGPTLAGLKRVAIDVRGAGRIDTVGAHLLIETRRALEAAKTETSLDGLDDKRRVLFDAVAARRVESPAPAKAPNPFTEALARTGADTRATGREFSEGLAFFGEICRGFGRIALKPSKLRWVSIVTHMERAGLQAVPIVMLISFLVGAIIAQQGAFQLRRFGAELFVVNLIGILVLREIGLLLAAIMFAGRTGSATTAEIGSMRMREEIDAMRVIGLDPIEVLVIPRLIALILALPLVTVVANIAAIFGAMLTSWVYIGLEPAAFLTQLQGALAPRHFFIGLSKAPFMALIIGLVACIEGMRVEGSTESLGRHTTAAVVKAIFLVIVVDGIFAIVYASIGI